MNKKYIFAYILVFLLLNSCSNTTTNTATNTKNTSVKNNNLSVNDNSNVNNTMMNSTQMGNMMNNIELKQEYYTPGGNYNLNLKIDLENNKITNVKASVPGASGTVAAYLDGFKGEINNKVVGMTLKEASKIDTITGASLTTGAFTDAIKTQL